MSYLDNPLQSNIHLSQNGLDVLAALLCFVRDAAFNQGTCFIRGDLTRDEDLGPGNYSLGLRRALAPLFLICMHRVLYTGMRVRVVVGGAWGI